MTLQDEFNKKVDAPSSAERSVSISLQKRTSQEDVSTTEELVKALNAAKTSEEQQNLLEWAY
ncbi:MAG: hypothetical protein AAF570_12175, partial [Bacteroidota bacterium]